MAFSRCLAALCLLWLFVAGRAEVTDTSQAIFDPAFRSLKVTLDANEFAPPVITLGDPLSRLTVSFDELSDERRFMRYELIHCDALWQPEGLVASEFLDGFNEGEVEDYEFSRATTCPLRALFHHNSQPRDTHHRDRQLSAARIRRKQS